MKYKILLLLKFYAINKQRIGILSWHLRFKINLSVQQRCVSEHVAIEDLLEHQVGSQVCHGS